MTTLAKILMVIHLLALAFGVGAATVKIVLLIKCNTHHSFLSTFFKVAKPITQLIIAGLVLLTLSGLGWLFIGYSYTLLFIAKLILVGAVWVIGPIIDNVVEPKFMKLAPLTGETATPEFIRIQRQYFMMEVTATALMYVITILGALL